MSAVPLDLAPGEEADPPPRRARRAAVVVVAAVVVLAAVVTATLVVLPGRADAPPVSAVAGPSAPITRRTMATTLTLSGELGYGPGPVLAPRSQGVVTWLPRSGAVLRRGDAVVRVDDRPVVLLYGDLPMYRLLEVPQADGSVDGASAEGGPVGPGPGETAASGAGGQGAGAEGTQASSTDAAEQVAAPAAPDPPPVQGRDVRQFEENLRALGYSGFTVDQTYTTRTAEAVRRWQQDQGMAVTGRVGPGDVVYADGALRMDRALAGVGDDAGGDLVATTSRSRVVTADVPVSDADWAVRGARVQVELPGGALVPGRVTAVSEDAAPGGDDTGGASGDDSVRDATVRVVIRPERKRRLTLARSPVIVRYIGEEHSDVLTVPVTALLALAEGGYGLELVDDAGGTRIVAVTAGLFAEGRVEVDGPDLREGLLVRLPG